MIFPPESPLQSVWYWHGKIHREGAPAVLMADGREFWYHLGKLHRPVEEGPALTLAQGSQWFFQHGELLYFESQNVRQRLHNFPWRNKVFHYMLHHDHDPAPAEINLDYTPTKWDKTFFQPMSMKDLLYFIPPIKTAGFTNLAQAAFMELLERVITKWSNILRYILSEDAVDDVGIGIYHGLTPLYEIL